ncbi:Putative ribosome biogenesis GTPase RsgA [Moraxella lacunata]|uniref:Small ribosomal subunit biogenesis GTPase RsgA n=1 Tax=Moraxella lacunata TaxID=477 RepID=A0A378TTB0_MORLA|nr:ribosome small subunit-dependent GTPase A [Moraxella lacunata]STZ63554.1 Putative ribosome biogenesis GTPase RsgA [Moraxella lacunata]
MSLIRKRKLTKNQTRQIQKNQETIIDDGTFATGVVVSHFGKQLDVQITALPDIMPQTALVLGQIWRCHVRTNLPMLTTGDTVKFSIDDVAGTGRIEQLLPRTTLITRPDRYHKVKPVASNVAILAIIFAPLPKPATGLIDRYILVARLAGVTPLLVLNKADLLDEHPDVVQIYQEYQALGERYGFDVIQSSSMDRTGLDTLMSHITGKLAIFAGQSGVGKSSLINQILPHAEQSTNIISVGSQLGQHTTTTSRLLAYDVGDLTQGGIIDTPGIREYGIWHLSADDILKGFDELNDLHGACQFRDCSHAPNAKGCAFWQAVADGTVLSRRVESFNELVAEAKQGASVIK